MDDFHYFVECPATNDPTKIPEFLYPSLFYASVKTISHIRMISREMEEPRVEFFARPDFAEKQKNLPYRSHIQVKSRYTIREWLAGKESNEIIIQVYHDSTDYDLITIPVCKYAYRDMKEIKLAKINKYLACPYCKNNMENTGTGYFCEKCGIKYPFNGNTVNFLTEDFKTDFSIIPTDNVSDHGHDQRVTQAIEKNPDKMYLDIGAGFKYKCFENVINFEIVNYPSTDVLGVGEKLPFLSNSIDGVISSAVLEHVKDPFACAKEMVRILKPGGELFCGVPFLQPQHGYPHHYYNMTKDGLLNLFPDMQINVVEVPDYFHPMIGITWILGGYLQGLPESLQQQFLKMTVEELICHFSKGESKSNPIITELSNNVRFAIACGTFIHAVKPYK